MDCETPKRQSGKRYAKRRRKRVFCVKSTSPVLKSASARKLSQPASSIVGPVFTGYRIMDLSNLCEAVKSCVACKVCGGEIDIEEVGVKGLGSTFAINCIQCKELTKFTSCRMVGSKNAAMEVNRRVIYAMRCLGTGLAGLRTFCSVMDLPAPVKQKSYNSIVSHLHRATGVVAEESMLRAADEEMDSGENEGPDISASFDGTWMKRGHTSLHGVVTCIGGNTGKVLDAEVKSAYCKACEHWKGKRQGANYLSWKAAHKDLCAANYKGSSGKMEVESAVDIFRRSQTKRGVRYAEYIGDGDTQSFSGVLKADPYGPALVVKKVECVGHVQKRMGTRLRKHKQSLSGKKLEDGKSLGGKGRLTDAAILKLTSYYGNAIRKYKGSADDMRKAIWAIFLHTRSTDIDPNHYFCPTDDDTWCGYNKAKASGKEAEYRHKNSIPTVVMDSIKCIFKDLSSPQLLKRCLGGKTQNNNESINSLIWKYCPKVTFCGRKVVEIATCEAIIGFNDGLIGRLRVMEQLECIPGQNCIRATALADARRIKVAEHRTNQATLEHRRILKAKRTVEVEKSATEEGITYGAGEFRRRTRANEKELLDLAEQLQD